MIPLLLVLSTPKLRDLLVVFFVLLFVRLVIESLFKLLVCLRFFSALFILFPLVAVLGLLLILQQLLVLNVGYLIDIQRQALGVNICG